MFISQYLDSTLVDFFPTSRLACLVAAHVNVFEVKMSAGDTKGYSHN